MNTIEAPHTLATASGAWPFSVTRCQLGIGAETGDIDLREYLDDTPIVGDKPF